MAWRSDTFSLHVHVGIRGADRAVAVCDRLRATLPELLAISANSPFLHGRDSGLHSAACIAQAALDRDDGALPEPPPNRLIEENLWRAIRYGLDGSMILERGEELPAAALADRLLAWTEPARTALAIDPQLPAESGAQRQRRALERGDPLDEIYAAEVDDTRRTYAADAPVDTGSCTALPEQ